MQRSALALSAVLFTSAIFVTNASATQIGLTVNSDVFISDGSQQIFDVNLNPGPSVDDQLSVSSPLGIGTASLLSLVAVGLAGFAFSRRRLNHQTALSISAARSGSRCSVTTRRTNSRAASFSSAYAISAFTLFILEGTAFAQIVPIAPWVDHNHEECFPFYDSPPTQEIPPDKAIDNGKNVTECVKRLTTELTSGKYKQPSPKDGTVPDGPQTVPPAISKAFQNALKTVQDADSKALQVASKTLQDAKSKGPQDQLDALQNAQQALKDANSKAVEDALQTLDDANSKALQDANSLQGPVKAIENALKELQDPNSTAGKDAPPQGPSKAFQEALKAVQSANSNPQEEPKLLDEPAIHVQLERLFETWKNLRLWAEKSKAALDCRKKSVRSVQNCTNALKQRAELEAYSRETSQVLHQTLDQHSGNHFLRNWSSVWHSHLLVRSPQYPIPRGVR